MSDIVESSKEAIKGGFQGIKKAKGLFVSIDKVPPLFTGTSDWGTEPKEQIKFILEDAAILEMFPGEEEFELKDGKFIGYVSYAEEGKKPHANSAYIKCWVASAEKLGKKPSQFVGTVVTLEKLPVVLFKKTILDDEKQPILGEDGKKTYEEVVTTSTWCFVTNETVDSEDVKEHVKKLLDGVKESGVLRKLLVDTKAKQFPELRDKHKAGTLAEYLGMTVVDGKYTS